MFGFLRRRAERDDPAAAAAKGDHVLAAALYRRRLADDPANALFWRKKLAEALLAAGRPFDAAEEYLAVADALAKQGKMAQVLAVYRTVLRFDADNPDVRARLAEIAGPPPAPARDEGPADAPAMTIRTKLRAFVPLFSEFDHDELAKIVEVMNVHHFRKGQDVFRQGDPGDSLYVLAQGEIALLVEGPEGKPVELERIADNGFFGELSALRPAPRNVTARCLADCEILELTRDYLEAVAIAHPRVWEILEEFQKRRQPPVGI